MMVRLYSCMFYDFQLKSTGECNMVYKGNVVDVFKLDSNISDEEFHQICEQKEDEKLS